MANAEHLAILKQGIEAWNRWRLKNKEAPDLNNAKLDFSDLSNADLCAANLAGAELRGRGSYQR